MAENRKFHIHPQNLKRLAWCWGILYNLFGQGLLCGWTFVCSSQCAVLQEKVRNIGPCAWGGVGNVDKGFYLWSDRTRAGEQLQVCLSLVGQKQMTLKLLENPSCGPGVQAFIRDDSVPIRSVSLLRYIFVWLVRSSARCWASLCFLCCRRNKLNKQRGSGCFPVKVSQPEQRNIWQQRNSLCLLKD